MMTVTQALKILNRLQEAAPARTAEKLAEISGLLQSLSNDNEYLVAQYGRALNPPTGLLRRPEPQAEAETGATDESVLKETEVLLLQLEEAVRPSLEASRQLTEQLLSGTDGAVAQAQRHALARVEDNVSATLSALDSVRQLIALRSGLLEVTPLIFSPAMLVREAERAVDERVRRRGLDLVVQYPANELQARGDYQRVLTIVLDLLDNAIRYTPPGGSIRLSAENLGTHILVSVEDTGIGLHPDSLEHIGEPFWRSPSQSLVREQGGAGLRLHLARQILAMQEGELFFSGEPGVGSTFSFTLPLAN